MYDDSQQSFEIKKKELNNIKKILDNESERSKSKESEVLLFREDSLIQLHKSK